MKVFVAAGLAQAALGYQISSSAQADAEMGANPIRRVVTLMQDMKKEIIAEGEKEEELYKKFQCYCKSNNGQLSADSEKAREMIDTNNAASEMKSGEKKQAEEELKQHKKDRADAQSALQTATEQRAKEKATYDESSAEYKTYIEGIQKALVALKKGAAGKAFIQSKFASTLRNIVQSSSIITMDASDQMTMLNFLQGDYHAVGGEIIGILDNMLDEMDKSLDGVIRQEESSVKSFLELKAAKETEIASATSSIEAKTALKGELAVQIVQHNAAAETAMKELQDAEQFLLNLKQTCADKAADWDERTKARAAEVQAVNEAIAVLNDDDALDIFKKSLSLMQTKKGGSKKLSFLQGASKNKESTEEKVSAILSGLSKSKNAALNLMAHTTMESLKSTVDFSKIIVMIDDMIKLLKEEQTSDEKTRDFCDEEFRTNAGETKSTTQKISSLTAEISASESSIAEAQELVAKKQTEVAELKKSMQEATEQRKQENAEFIEMQQLNHSAVQLINKAMNKLNKFYNPGQYKAPEDRDLTEEERVLRGAGQDIGDTTAKTAIAGTSQTTTVSFLQKIAGNNKAPTLPAAPETYGEHKAKGQKSNSVITLLKNLINDLEKETQAAEHAEKTAQRDYETLSTDAAKQQAECETMIADTTGAIANEEEKLNAATVNKQAQEATLAELQDQKTQLHKECDFIVAHFEERREAREKEIDGLTSAKSILSGANFS